MGIFIYLLKQARKKTIFFDFQQRGTITIFYFIFSFCAVPLSWYLVEAKLIQGYIIYVKERWGNYLEKMNLQWQWGFFSVHLKSIQFSNIPTIYWDLKQLFLALEKKTEGEINPPI